MGEAKRKAIRGEYPVQTSKPRAVPRWRNQLMRPALPKGHPRPGEAPPRHATARDGNGRPIPVVVLSDGSVYEVTKRGPWVRRRDLVAVGKRVRHAA